MALFASLVTALLVATAHGHRPPEAEVRRPRSGPVVLQPGEQRPGDAEVMRHLEMLENLEMLQMLDLFAEGADQD